MSQIGSIQALRAIAALLIAFGHLQREALLMPAAAQQGFSPIFLDLTGAGVDLFFVISGFVMVYASQSLFGQTGAARLFLTRRVARIVPLYWGATTLFLLMIASTPGALESAAPTFAEIAKSYFFIPYFNASSDLMQPAYKLGWTLNYEMFFYIVFAATLALPLRAAAMVVVAFFGGLVALGVWLAPAPGPLAFWTHPIILEFAIGAAIGAAYVEGWRLNAATRWTLTIAAIVCLIVVDAFAVQAEGFTRLLAWGAPAAAIVAAAALSNWRWPDGRAARSLILLGDASYAIYLLHPFAMRALRLVWVRIGADAIFPPAVFIVIGLALVIAISVIVYRHFERPLTRALQAALGAPATKRDARGDGRLRAA